MSYMEISNIEKAFDKNEVLKGISLNIEQGEFVSLLGPPKTEISAWFSSSTPFFRI